jgi:hypothetical protein
MDTTIEQWNIPEGTDVVGADGDKVGKVVAAQSNYIVVEKGFFFPTDYYIPTTAIANFDGDKVYLSVTKDEALNQGWDLEPPASPTGTGIAGETPAASDRLAGTAPPDAAMGATGATMRDAGTSRPAGTTADETTVSQPGPTDAGRFTEGSSTGTSGSAS